MTSGIEVSRARFEVQGPGKVWQLGGSANEASSICLAAFLVGGCPYAVWSSAGSGWLLLGVNETDPGFSCWPCRCFLKMMYAAHWGLGESSVFIPSGLLEGREGLFFFFSWSLVKAEAI